MFGPWMALTVRALRVDSRSWLSHAFRLIFVLIVFAGLVSAHMTEEIWGAPGLQLFSFLSWMNLIFITLAAVSLFATPITEEKEEATLGLLRMAGIGPLGLLLGKSTTRLWSVLLVLLVQFPFTLLAITLGGVLWEQVVAHYIAASAYLIFVGNLGLLCSVIAPRSSNAAFLTAVLLFLVLVCPAIVAGMLMGMGVRGNWLLDVLNVVSLALLAGNVWAVQGTILTTGFSGDLWSVQVWSNLAAGVVLFFFSWLSFDFFTRNHLVSVPARGGLLVWRREAKTRNMVGRWLSPGRAWSLPFVWKDFYFIAGGWPLVVGKFVGYFLIILGATWLQLSGSAWGQDRPGEIFAGHAIWLMILLGGMELALLASKIFREETRWQTLPALMMLPSNTPAIAYTKALGCLISVLPALFWLGMGLGILPKVLPDFSQRGGLEQFLVIVYCVTHFLFFLHLTSYLSLLMKWGALPLSFGLILFAHFGGCNCCIAPLAMLGVGPNGESVFYVIVTVMIGLNVALSGLLQFGIGMQLRVIGERG